jgi:hypothetical protein
VTAVSQEELDAATPGVGWHVNKDGAAHCVSAGEFTGERAEWAAYLERPWKALTVEGLPFAVWLEHHDEDVAATAAVAARQAFAAEVTSLVAVQS